MNSNTYLVKSDSFRPSLQFLALDQFLIWHLIYKPSIIELILNIFDVFKPLDAILKFPIKLLLNYSCKGVRKIATTVNFFKSG